MMKAYKLMRIKKNGKVYPLFINKKVPTELGVWIPAEEHKTKGFAVRKGWHCTTTPYAPHLKENLASGEKRIWVEVEVDEYEMYERPESQGGTWVLAQNMKINRVLKSSEVAYLRGVI